MDIQKITAGAQDALTVSRVFGEAYERDGVTVIPVAKVAGGAGGGSGETEGANGGAEQEGAGAGLALSARPVGVYVIRDGKVRWEPALDLTRVIVGGQFVGIVALLVLRALVKRALPRKPRSARKRGRRASR